MSREQIGKLQEIFRADPSIMTVGRLLSMQLGPDEVLLTAAVQFRRGMRIDEVEQAIDRLESTVRAAYPAIHHIYFQSAGLRPYADVPQP
jgi:divalent metal cation (Fe/Co/Zn/Cd) transporter